MSFYYLLAGHLLGDFALQTNYIANKKTKETKWLLVHVLIVTLCMFMFVIPFGQTIILMVPVSGFIHFLVDDLKLKFSTTHAVKNIFFFLVDQGCHVLVLYVMSLFAESPSFLLNSKLFYMIFIMLVIIPVSSVLIQLLLKIVQTLEDQSFYVKNEKILGNLNRFIFFMIFYWSHIYSFFLIMLPLIMLIYTFYFVSKLRSWMTPKYFVAKMIFEILFSGVGYLFYVMLVS